MATITYHQSRHSNYSIEVSKTSLFANFITWCTNQQANRLMWLGIALMMHGCVLTPLTLVFVVLSGANLALFLLATIAMGMAVVANLAALPTKYTIPVFIASIFLDLGIVMASAFLS